MYTTYQVFLVFVSILNIYVIFLLKISSGKILPVFLKKLASILRSNALREVIMGNRPGKAQEWLRTKSKGVWGDLTIFLNLRRRVC